MPGFSNPYLSHEHSMEILGLLYGYDSFLDSLKVICDMGAGTGLDAEWWATLETRDDPPEPRNYRVYAVDKSFAAVDPEVKATPGIRWIESNFEEPSIVPELIDLLWCHNSFQYAINPIGTLANWNRMMNTNGMLVLNIPMHTAYSYDRLQTRSFSNCYYTYNICNLMYMLAVNGFDCRDCYIYMAPNYGWVHFCVYKNYTPLDPATTTWFDFSLSCFSCNFQNARIDFIA
mgnify:CR=1 FL=1